MRKLVGWHRWDEMSGKRRKAITFCILGLTFTFYFGKGKYCSNRALNGWRKVKIGNSTGYVREV